MKCPNCGAELPSPSHFGIKASPKNYITPQLILAPGKKYQRTFAILFYPERQDEELGHLSPCVVIASEEYPKDNDKSYPFISGSKFYKDDLGKLGVAAEYVLLTEVAFKAYITGRSLETLFNNRLRELYHSPDVREDLSIKAQSILNRMKLCADITRKESEGK
ncbi:MAG: hypothetical protein QXU44_02190 [Candidatus Caldarchaeum sp.]